MKNLTPGVVYRFRVRAENVHGRSEPSESSEEVVIQQNGIHKENDRSEISTDDKIVIRQGGDFKSRFILLDELGKGRFGVVHKVIDRETEQVLAAKIVKCIKAKDKLKIHEEIEIMRSMHHPKLLQLAASFESAREIIMVTELLVDDLV